MKKPIVAVVLALLLLAPTPAIASEGYKHDLVTHWWAQKHHPNKAIPADGVWYRLAICESSNTNLRDGRFLGFFQFTQSTWTSNGGTGSPLQHGYMEQLRVAKVLQSRRGWQPWPACSRKLGLR